MHRTHWIEISDEPWCPLSIRRAVTDYCRFVTERSGIFDPVVPMLADALKRSGSRAILDLGSGAGGAWGRLLPRLRELLPEVTVCLSDLNPDPAALERVCKGSGQTITFRTEPVDATKVPQELKGFRTMFCAFHHLRPNQARAMLTDAVSSCEGIAVFEGAQRGFFQLLFSLGTPVRVLILAPFISPFRWSRLFWTYVVPLLPLILLHDTIVSCLRIYSAQELMELVAGFDDYQWSAGTVPATFARIPVPFFIGVPVKPGE
jgi:hypothetical protein